MRFGASRLVLVSLSCLLPVYEAGIQPFDLVLEPTDQFVHYNDGYIRGPGFIDLGGLLFTPISDAFTDAMIDIEGGTENDDLTGGGNLRRILDQGGGGLDVDGTIIDIVVFRLPPICAHKKRGCDWPSLGVGNRTDDGFLRWCCSRESLLEGLCTKQAFGRLITDKEKFDANHGNHQSISIPATGDVRKKIDRGKIDEEESGTYVVMYANCNEAGREVYVSGVSAWKSSHGFLPGELYGFMFFYVIATVVYFVMLIWYGVAMYVNEENRIEIEKWVFFSIVLGLLEMIFRTGDCYIWNADGYRSNFIIWIMVLVGVVKQAISRCLIVMVSLGWGVVRDSLGSTMSMIVILGTVYVVSTAVRDFLIIFAIEDVNKLSKGDEKELIDVAKLMNYVVAFVDVVFVMWILDALNNTMMYLENMSQTRKLERFLKLRLVILIAIVIAVFRGVFILIDSVDNQGIIAEEHAWSVQAAEEFIYLYVLVGVAYLWQPNPNAKEYAYVMELPAMGEDGDNELELSDMVPSAADPEMNKTEKKSGYRDDLEDNSSFQIT